MSGDARPSPQALDAERALLGGLIVDAARLDEVEPVIASADFYRPDHGRLYLLLRAMQAAGGPVDLVTVSDEVTRRGADTFGGLPYVLQLPDDVVSTANLPHYAGIIRDHAERRRLLATADQLREAAYSAHTATDAAAAALASIGTLASQRAALPVERARARFKDAASYLDVPPDPIPWLLKTRRNVSTWTKAGIVERVGVLPLAKVGILASAGGVGKSTALVDLAVSVAIGWPWMGAFDVVEPGAVLLVLAEDDEAEAHRKIHYAIRRAAAHVDDCAGMAGRAGIGFPADLHGSAPRTGADVRAMAGARIRVAALAGTHPALTGDDDRTPSEWHRAIADQLREVPPDNAARWALVILDPLSRFATPDAEKDNVSATRFIELAEAFAVRAADDERGTGPAVLLAHHTGKASRKEGEAVDATAIRGVGGLHDAVRWAATLDPRPWVDPIDGKPLPSLLTFQQVKGNLGPPLPALTLARRAVAGEPPTLSIATLDETAAYEAATAKAPKATPAPGPTAARGKAGRDPAADDA